jgi:putative tryptophan/tyrosine transport system substrate-binding protein
MKRRELILLLGGAMMAARTLSAEQKRMPVIGFLSGGAPDSSKPYVAAFRKGLTEVGYAEDRNVAIEYRWQEGRYDHAPAMAADLVDRGVTVIVASGGPASAFAAKAATTTIPIVFVSGTDPVESGLVASLNHPGGNITGVTFFAATLVAKRLELLHELVPDAGEITVLVNPSNPNAEPQLAELREAAGMLGLSLAVLKAKAESEIDAAFATLAERSARALLVAGDTFFNSRRDQLAKLAARFAVPAIYEFREYAAAGGLISYASRLTDAYYQAGLYAGRILDGAKPADLPIVQPTTFELVINLKTAKALGLTIPPLILARADELIE